MGKSMPERILAAVNDALDDVVTGLDGAKRPRSNGMLSGVKGVAVGAGVVALAPLALKGISKLVKVPGVGGVEDVVKKPGKAVKGATSKLGDSGGSVGGAASDKVSKKIDKAAGPSRIPKDSGSRSSRRRSSASGSSRSSSSRRSSASGSSGQRSRSGRRSEG